MSKHEHLTRDTHRQIDKQRVGLVLSNQYNLSLETAYMHFCSYGIDDGNIFFASKDKRA